MPAMTEPSTLSGPPAFDAAALARLRRFGGDKLLHDMVALFLEQAPVRVVEARIGVTGGDAAAVRASLHSLKSSAAQIGALRVHDICAAGEGLAATGTVEGLQQVIDELEGELPRACRWLDDARTGGQ